MAMGFITKVKRFFAQADLILLALCCAAALFGILLIASATNYTGSLRYVIVPSIALVLGVARDAFLTWCSFYCCFLRWEWIPSSRAATGRG